MVVHPFEHSDRALRSVIAGTFAFDAGRFSPQFKWRKDLLGVVSRSLQPQRILPTGSWSHDTAIAGVSDRDYFLVLDGVPDCIPMAMLAGLYADLSAAVSSSTVVRLDPPVVSVEDPYTRMALEFVPAFRDGERDYLIPDAEAHRWIPTDPLAHTTYLLRAEEVSPGVRHVIRLMKRWKGDVLPDLSSLYLEMVIAQYCLATPLQHYLEHLIGVLGTLVRSKLADIPDPSVAQPRHLSALHGGSVDAKTALSKVVQARDLALRIDAAERSRAKIEVDAFVSELFGSGSGRGHRRGTRILKTRRDPNRIQFRGAPTRSRPARNRGRR